MRLRITDRAPTVNEFTPRGRTALPDRGIRFRRSDATPEQLHAACIDNHLDWLTRLATASGGEVHITSRLHWAVTRDRLPEVTAAVLGGPDAAMRREIDELVEYCRASDVEVLSFWAATEQLGAGVDGWLQARGLRRGEQPQWMVLDLHSLPDPPPVLSRHQGVSAPDRFDDFEVPELQCYGEDTWRTRQAMQECLPRRVWHLVIWQDGRPAGQIALNATEGELGVLGVHNVILLPQARASGLALDRFTWLQRFALDLGCRYLVTHAFDRVAVFDRMFGFRDLGSGCTWWTGELTLRQRPEAARVRLAEAVASGDLGALGAASWEPGELDRPLPNGLTPLRFAGELGQAGAARWLLAAGASPDVLAAWDLGWRDEVRQLLHDQPTLVHGRSPRSGKTLLHAAAERGDGDLATALLAAGADPQARDQRFQTTALDWALKLRHHRVAAVLRRHTGG